MAKLAQHFEGYGTAVKEELPLFAKAVKHIPHSATGDPITSFEAAEKIIESGHMHKQLKKVYEALKEHDGATSAELAIYMGVDRVLTARRLPDLRKLLVVENGKIRICKVTGFRSITWFLNNNNKGDQNEHQTEQIETGKFQGR